MPQAWTVSKAFLSTDRDTKEVQVVNTPGGEMHKYMVQVENQPVQGWFSVLKKPGNEVKEGDELYGDIAENNWGKPQFTRANRPDGNFGGGQSSAPAPQSNSGRTTDQKLDYIISLLENRNTSPSPAKSAPVDDDGPVDLSDLDY